MVWLMFFLPVVSAAALPTKSDSIAKLENSCAKKNDPWVCLLSYGVNYLVGRPNGAAGRTFGDGEKLFESLFSWSDSENDADGVDRTWKINRKNVVPLVVGVSLKVLGLIPIALGKLALLGSIAILASKLSLLLSMVIALKKFFGGGGLISLNPLGYHGHAGHYEPHYGGYGGGHRREAFIIRGRDMEEANAIQGINKWAEKNHNMRWKTKIGPQLPRPEMEAESITDDPYEGEVGDLAAAAAAAAAAEDEEAEGETSPSP